jgi:hypothetical protein
MSWTFQSFILLVLMTTPVMAQQVFYPDDPSALLGAGPTESIAARGPPVSVSALRGSEPWQDDVVFSYSDGSRLHLFDNHLWQIVVSLGYQGSILGVFIGDEPSKVISLLGEPFIASGDAMVWRLPWRGYPVMMRMIAKESKVVEIAIFRADF